MSAHFQSSGPRSNAYSESKFTNWTKYDPFFAEARAALKRFDSRIPESPRFPHVIVLRLTTPDFGQACTREEVVWRMGKMAPASLAGLRAVFILAGTRKQEKSWYSSLAYYGMYWRSSVFLCALPFAFGRYDRDKWRDFYLNDVLVHEIAHHVDRAQKFDHADKEAFAHAYVQKQRALTTVGRRVWRGRKV